MLGIMTKTVKLLGTSMVLRKGDRVFLTPTYNLPDKTNFYASPANAVWSDGVDRYKEYSILVNPKEVDIIGQNGEDIHNTPYSVSSVLSGGQVMLRNRKTNRCELWRESWECGENIRGIAIGGVLYEFVEDCQKNSCRRVDNAEK